MDTDPKTKLVIFPIPALVAVLLKAERDKGSALTEAEVLRIRDSATCVAVPSNCVGEITKNRGYEDISPENCWVEWNDMRNTYGKDWGLKI